MKTQNSVCMRVHVFDKRVFGCKRDEPFHSEHSLIWLKRENLNFVLAEGADPDIINRIYGV
jgi:hypothetical protein